MGLLAGKATVGLVKSLTANNLDTSNAKDCPSISGGKNQSALGKAIPLILGKTLFAPYYINEPYVMESEDDDGQTQYYTGLYLLGYNDITVRDICLGKDRMIATNSSNVENGTISIDNDSFYKDYEPQLELKQSGEVSLCSQKVVQDRTIASDLRCIENENKELIRTPVYAFSAKYPEKVSISIQMVGLQGHDSKNKTQNATVSIGTQMSLDGGVTWQPFAYFNNATSTSEGTVDVKNSDGTVVQSPVAISEFTRNTVETIRFSATKQFSTFNEIKDCKNNTVEIRVWRINKETDSSTQDTVSVTRVTTWCYDNEKSKESGSFVAQIPILEKWRDKTARLGFKIKAGTNVDGNIDELNCILTSKARIWNGTSWTTDTHETSNPSALALHTMTGAYRGQYKYKDSKINLEKFGELYEDCDEDFNFGKDSDGNDIILKRFSCDGVVLNPTKTKDVVSQILDTCRATLCIYGSKYGVNIDKRKSTPVMILNNQNLLKRSNTKNFDDLPDGYTIDYVDALQKYIQNSFIAYPLPQEKPVSEMKLENKSYPFTTNVRRAYCRAMYEYACAKLRPEVWNATVSVDGNLIEVGSLIEIQDDTISVGIGDGAEITKLITENGYITGIETDGEFNISLSNSYGCKITVANGLAEPFILKKQLSFTKAGLQSTLMFEEPILSNASNKPTIGDIVSFGLYEKETDQALVIGKKANGDDTFDLVLVPYRDAVYDADLGNIPDFDANITTPNQAGLEVNDGRATLKDLYDALGRTTDSVMAEVENKYNNTLIYLYRVLGDREAPMTNTGITAYLEYDFTTNTLRWGADGTNNGWTSDSSIKTANNTVYVTTATAFSNTGKYIIQPNEWSAPVPFGMNGTNGLSATPIFLFKTCPSIPPKPSIGLSWNFTQSTYEWDGGATGDSWLVNKMPDTNEGYPIYVCQATALSSRATSQGTDLVDHIEEAEWSDPTLYSANNGLTPAQVKEIVDQEIPGASTPYVKATPQTVGFAVHNSGYVTVNQTITINVSVTQYGEELNFTFINPQEVVGESFNLLIGADGKSLIITAIQKKIFAYIENWVFPIAFLELLSNTEYHHLDGEGTDIRQTPRYCQLTYEKLTSKPEDWDENYGSYFKDVNGVATQNTSSQWQSGVYYKQVYDSPYGNHIYAKDYSTEEVQVNAVPKVGGTYRGAIKNLTELDHLMNDTDIDELIIGDYITWTGSDTSSYLCQEGTFYNIKCYSFTGGTGVFRWQLDEDRGHIANTIGDVVGSSVQELEYLEQHNPDASNFFKSLFASKLVAKTIVAVDGFIENLFSKRITIASNGSIESADYSPINGSGFKISADGKAVLYDAEVKGNINALSLTIGTGKTDISTYINNLITQSGSITTDSISQNVIRTQAIYKKIGSSSSEPTAPSSYITSTTDGWVLNKPSIGATETDVIIWSCTQYQTYDDVSKNNPSFNPKNPSTWNDSPCTSTKPTVLGDTIIDTKSGYIRTNLIEVDSLLSRDVTIKTTGMIHTVGYKSGDPYGFQLNARDGVIECNHLIANGGTFNGSVTADYAKFNNGLIKNYIYYNDVTFTNLHSYLKSYSVKGIYEANGYLRFRSSQSWFGSIARDFEILNVVCGNGFNIINGYKSSIYVSNTIALQGSSRDGYYLSGDVSLVDNGYEKFSVIDVNGTWYYYDGHNTNVNSYDKTGSITGSIKLDVCISY